MDSIDTEAFLANGWVDIGETDGPTHYRIASAITNPMRITAEEKVAGLGLDAGVAIAQVHATLALTAATLEVARAIRELHKAT